MSVFGYCPLLEPLMDTIHYRGFQWILSIVRGRKFLWFYGDSKVRLGLMVEFVIRVNQQRTAYIPKEVIEILGYEWLLVPNAKAAVVYPRACDLKTAIKSVLVIVKGLKLMLTTREWRGESRDA